MKRFFRAVCLVVIIVCIGAYVSMQITDAHAATVEAEEIKNQISSTVTVKTEVPETSETEVATVDEVPDFIGNTYEEGQDFGLLSYAGADVAMTAGTTAKVLDEHKAMVHLASTTGHLVVLGHSYSNGSVFGLLCSVAEEGMEVSIQNMDGETMTFEACSVEWVSEDTYNTSEYVESIFSDESDLMLITCQKQDGVRGRLIVRCEKI